MPSYSLTSPASTSHSLPSTVKSDIASADSRASGDSPASPPLQLVPKPRTPATSHLNNLADLPDEQNHEDHPLTAGEKIKEFIMDNQVVINTFIAGGLAGATSRTVVSPLERLKIILQVQAASSKGSTGQAYGGVWSSLGRMWQEEGMAGFMKGNGINVVRILPYSALQFTSYGGFKNLLSKWSGEEMLSTPLRLTAGAGAGIVAVVATYPLDLVRARLSIATANLAVLQNPSSSGAAVAAIRNPAFTAADAKLGMVGMTKRVYATEGGLRGLYRGCWATAVGVAPYVSLNFYLYESLKAYILPADLAHGPEISETDLAIRKLGCGALAGATSLLFTHPFDVLRRKLQVAGLSSLSPQYTGAIDAMRKSIKAEGFWKGMYRGLTPNIIKVTPSIAVSFYTFETVRDLLADYQHLEDEDKVV